MILDKAEGDKYLFAEDKYVFASPFKGDIAKSYFEKTVSNEQEWSVNGFKRHWKYDSEKGLIIGSSTFLALRLDGQVRPDGLWIPIPQEARILDEKKKLSNGYYRDFGIVVYSQGNPNERVAKGIIERTKAELPLVVPFKALNPGLSSRFPYGIAISLTENPLGILSGKEARQYLHDLKYKGYRGSSDTCGLDRDGNGIWYANWSGLGGFYDDGRVDWMCSKGTHADLETAHKGLLQRRDDAKIQKLETERDEKQEEFVNSLK